MSAVAAPVVFERSPGYWSTVLSRFLRDRVARAAGAVVRLLVLLAIFGGYLTPADPMKTSILNRLKPIGADGFPLGSDELGRDMLSRLMIGTRLSLFMGITPVLCAFAV